MTDAVHLTSNRPCPWPHRVAVLLVCLVFLLIWVGGLVTTCGPGVAVTDGPGPSWWNLLFEHGDRLLGVLVGLVAIGLVGSVWLRESRRWMRPVVLGALVLVILQGSLGGARLLHDQRQLPMLHDWFALAFFGLTVALAVVTSPWWHGQPAGDLEPIDPAIASRFTRWTIFTCLLVTLQILLGAWLRNITWYDSVGLFRTVLWMHLFIAAAIFIHAILLLVTAGRGGDGLLALQRQTVWLVLLVCPQIGLGGGTWILNYSWPGWMGRFQFAARHIIVEGSMTQSLTTTTHVAVGSLVLAVSILIAMRWFRLRWCQRNVSRRRRSWQPNEASLR